MMNDILSAIVGAAAVLALAGAGVQTYRLKEETISHNITKLQYSDLVNKYNAAAIKAQDENQAIAKEWQSRMDAARDEAQQRTTVALAERDRAVAVGDKLRHAYAAAIARSCSGVGTGTAATTERSNATETTGNLLADVQSRIDEAAGAIADYADEARSAGLTCQQSF